MNPSTMTPYVHDPRAYRLSTVQRMVAQHARVVADFGHAPEYDSDDSDSDDEQDGYFTPDENDAPPKVQKITPQRDRPYAVPLLQRQLNGRSSPAPSGSSGSPTSARSHMITNPCYGSSRTTFTMMAPRAAVASTTSFMTNSTKSSPSPTSSHFQLEPSRPSSQFAYVGRNGQVGKSHFHPAADAYMRNYDPQAHSNTARTQLAGRSQTPVPIPAPRLVQPRDRASSTSSGRTAAAGAVATLTRRVSTEFKQAAQGVRRRCSITSMKETGTRVQQLSKKVSGSLKDAAKKATDALKHRPAKVVMVA